MNEKERILRYVETEFAKDGFHKTTMDTLAKGLKISKKTLYKYFDSKNELLDATLDRIMARLEKDITEISGSNRNAVEKLHLYSSLVARRISQIGDPWIEDIKIYRPDLWAKVEKFRHEQIFSNIRTILDQGKKESLIINKPNNIILTIIISSIQAVVNPSFIMHNNITMTKAAKTTLEIVFNGFLTKKGKKLFKLYRKEE